MCKLSKTKKLIFFLAFFLGLHLQPMEVPRLGVESKLKELAYTTTPAYTTMRIQAVSVTHTTAHSNVRSLAH